MTASPHNVIKASYTVLPEAGDWSAIRQDVERHLPLQNLHWKPASRPLRTILSLPVELIDLATANTISKQAAHETKALLERPFLHLLFINSDDSERYRSSLRQQIRDWIDSVTRSGSHEYLIVHVAASRQGAAKFYQRKSTILEKIRTDFGSSKRDRCVQIVTGADAEPTSFAEFTSKAKECILAAFDATVALIDEDVRRADSQRQLDGWQYLSFFRQKEVLADLFEAMQLWDDALVQYDELEASFFQALKDGHVDWGGKLGQVLPEDDAVSIVDPVGHDYRDLIARDAIGLFYFRIYLFARQSQMLFSLGNVAEVARRGSYFLSTFARSLAQQKGTLGRYFVESWTYSAVFTILTACDDIHKTARPSTTKDPSQVSYQRSRSELLDLARKQLEKLGLSAGHLPFCQPFLMSIEESNSGNVDVLSSAGTASGISRSDLVRALNDLTQFDAMYTNLTNQTIEAYRSVGRRRCALRLQSCLAALERQRDRLKQSERMFSRLPPRFVELRWSKLEALHLAHCIFLQERLGLDRERLLSSLALLRAGTIVVGKQWSVECVADDVIGVTPSTSTIGANLMSAVRKISETLTKDFAAIAFPTFAIASFAGSGQVHEAGEGLRAVAIVENGLPTAVEIDEVRLKLQSAAGTSIWFTTGKWMLQPGKNEVPLRANVLVQGLCHLELSQIRFGRIIFQYSHRPLSAQNLAPDIRTLPATHKQPKIAFPSDTQFLHLDVCLHDTVLADKPRKVSISLATRTEDVKSLTVRLHNASSAMAHSLDLSTFEVTSRDSVQVGEHCVTPHTLQVSSLGSLTALIGTAEILPSVQQRFIESFLVEYTLASSPDIRRTFRTDVALTLDLPLSIDIREYHRLNASAIDFEISAQRGTTVHLSKVVLREGGEDLASPRPVHAVLHDRNRFRNSIMLKRPDEDVPRAFVLEYRPLFTKNDRIRGEVARYASEAGIQGTSAVNGAVAAVLDSWARGEPINELGHTLPAAFMHDLRVRLLGDSILRWHTLVVPLAVKRPQVVCQSEVVSNGNSCTVGTPFEMTFHIKIGSNATTCVLDYELLAEEDDWLLSGKTKGLLNSQEQQYQGVVTVAAVRAGILPLPRVYVSPATRGEVSCVSHAITAARTIQCYPRASFSTYTVA